MSTLPTCPVTKGIISALHDNPNTDDNLTAAQLKAKFDQEPDGIIDYLNNTLIPAMQSALDALVAAGAVVTNMIADHNVTNAKLDNTPGSEAVSTGVMQDDCVTTAKLDHTEGLEAVDTGAIRDGSVTLDKLSDFITFTMAANIWVDVFTVANSRGLIFIIGTTSSSAWAISANSSNNVSAVNLGGDKTTPLTDTGNITFPNKSTGAARCLLIVLSGTMSHTPLY